MILMMSCASCSDHCKDQSISYIIDGKSFVFNESDVKMALQDNQGVFALQISPSRDHYIDFSRFVNWDNQRHPADLRTEATYGARQSEIERFVIDGVSVACRKEAARLQCGSLISAGGLSWDVTFDRAFADKAGWFANDARFYIEGARRDHLTTPPSTIDVNRGF